MGTDDKFTQILCQDIAQTYLHFKKPSLALKGLAQRAEVEKERGEEAAPVSRREVVWSRSDGRENRKKQRKWIDILETGFWIGLRLLKEEWGMIKREDSRCPQEIWLEQLHSWGCLHQGGDVCSGKRAGLGTRETRSQDCHGCLGNNQVSCHLVGQGAHRCVLG
jgi:hypothetical protein